MWEAGALGFKGFLVELHGAPMLSEGVLLDIMREVKSFNGTCLYHCESDTICRKGQEKLEEEGLTDYRSMLDWRSMEAEYMASMELIHLVELTGLPVHHRPRQPAPHSGGDPDGPAARARRFTPNPARNIST